eukprot:364663-Chlamydomonas_euryale.AAC.1
MCKLGAANGRVPLPTFLHPLSTRSLNHTSAAPHHAFAKPCLLHTFPAPHLHFQVDEDGSNEIDFGEFMHAIMMNKTMTAHAVNEEEVLDAWTAVGGNGDTSGGVSISKLQGILTVGQNFSGLTLRLRLKARALLRLRLEVRA